MRSLTIRSTAALALLALGTALPAGLQAQVRARPRLALAAGATVPLAPESFADHWGAQVALAGGLHWPVSSRVAVGLEVGYYRFGFDAEAFESDHQATFPDVHVTGNDLIVVLVTPYVEATLLSRGTTRPFASLGAGWYHAGTSDADASSPGSALLPIPSLDEDAFGLRLGLGVRTALAPGSHLVLDATWHIAWIDPDPIHFVPVRVGVRF